MIRLPLPDALPGIKGRWLTLVKTVWLALFAFALVGTTFGTWAIGTSTWNGYLLWAELGLRAVPGNGERMVVHPLGASGQKAGIAPGSFLLSINGAEVTKGDVRNVLAEAGPAPTIRLASPQGETREVQLARSRDNALAGDPDLPVSYVTFWYINLASAFAINLALLAVATLLFRRRARDPVAMLLSSGMLLIVGTDVEALGTSYFEAIGGVAVFCGWTMVIIGLFAFPDGRFTPRWTLVGVPLTFFYLAASLGGFSPIPFLNGALMVVAVVAITHRYIRLPAGPARQQVKWTLFGFAAGTVFTLAQTALSSTDSHIAADPGTAMWLHLAYVFCYTGVFVTISLGLLVSLLRFRLYDAEAAISRSAGYAVLTLLLAGTFGASAKLIEWFFETSFGGDAGALPGAIGAGLAVVLITPMHSRIHRWAERRFQKDLLHLRRDLPDCVGDLRETAGTTELLDEVLKRIMAGSRAVRAAVVVDGKTVAARGDGGSDFPVSVPLRVEHKQTEIGSLLVGPRPDGSALGKDERQALAEIADPVARALRIVRLREERQHLRDSEMDEIRSALQRLAKAVADRGEALPT